MSSLTPDMKRWVLTCLLVLYSMLAGLETGTYTGTGVQLYNNVSSANPTPESPGFQKVDQEGRQRNSTVTTDEPGAKKPKALAPRILYVTNRTASLVKHEKVPERKGDSTGLAGLSVDQNSTRWQRGRSPLTAQTQTRRGAAKPNFQTSRGRNWCAYVHTRLSPTVVIDTVTSYLPAVTDPCYWSQKGCPQRSHLMTKQPSYRMRHQIVTSLEWRCCLGYVGPQCQPKDAPTPTQLLGSQSVSGAEKGTVTEESVTHQKMADESTSQSDKDLFQKWINNMAIDVSYMKNRLASLEGKLNTEKENDIPSITEALKSETIQGIFRDIVQKQIKASYIEIQETTANVFKTISDLSEQLWVIKANQVKINETTMTLLSSQKRFEENNENLIKDIQSLKDQASSLKADIDGLHSNVTEEMSRKYETLEDNPALEQQKQTHPFNAVNHSTSETKEVKSHAFSGGLVPDSADRGNESGAWPQRESLLRSAILEQTQQNLQLRRDLRVQELKLQNLTAAVGRQRRLAGDACEAAVMRCRQDLLPQLEEIRAHVATVNQSLSAAIQPLDAAVNAIEDRISHVSYDLEELKPIVEQRGLVGNESLVLPAIREQMEGLINTVKTLNTSFANRKDALNTQTRGREKERLSGCREGIEDALNETMTVLNKAMDSAKDDYYVLRNDLDLTNWKMNKIYDDFEKQSNYSLVEVKLLNSSVFSLRRKFETFDAAQNVSETHDLQQNLTHLSQQLIDAVSQLDRHETAISHLQGTSANTSSDFQEYRILLQNLESKMSALADNANLDVKLKKPKQPVENGLAWKYKDLSRRVQYLVAQLVNLTSEVSWLKGSASQGWLLYHNLSGSLERTQAWVPQVYREHINLTLLHEGLDKFLKREGKTFNQTTLSSPTAYLNSALTRIFTDVSELRRETQELNRKLDETPEMNATAVSAGRNQRNTDNIMSQAQASVCSSSPCRNGGTCIHDWPGYICACRFPFSGTDCTMKLVNDSAPSPDFSKGSYRYVPMVTFFVAHTYAMSAPGPIRFNHLYVNYGASFSTGSGKFAVPYLGVYIFRYAVESSSPDVSGYVVVDDEDKLAFRYRGSANQDAESQVITGDAVLELNVGQRVWLRLETGEIPSKYPPVTTFSGYLLYRT